MNSSVVYNNQQIYNYNSLDNYQKLVKHGVEIDNETKKVKVNDVLNLLGVNYYSMLNQIKMVKKNHQHLFRHTEERQINRKGDVYLLMDINSTILLINVLELNCCPMFKMDLITYLIVLYHNNDVAELLLNSKQDLLQQEKVPTQYLETLRKIALKAKHRYELFVTIKSCVIVMYLIWCLYVYMQ